MSRVDKIINQKDLLRIIVIGATSDIGWRLIAWLMKIMPDWIYNRI